MSVYTLRRAANGIVPSTRLVFLDDGAQAGLVWRWGPRTGRTSKLGPWIGQVVCPDDDDFTEQRHHATRREAAAWVVEHYRAWLPCHDCGLPDDDCECYR
jgi:hypothetical protein